MNTDMIAFEAEMKRLRGAYIMDIAPACEMYRAALARVAELVLIPLRVTRLFVLRRPNHE